MDTEQLYRVSDLKPLRGDTRQRKLHEHKEEDFGGTEDESAELVEYDIRRKIRGVSEVLGLKLSFLRCERAGLLFKPSGLLNRTTVSLILVFLWASKLELADSHRP